MLAAIYVVAVWSSVREATATSLGFTALGERTRNFGVRIIERTFAFVDASYALGTANIPYDFATIAINCTDCITAVLVIAGGCSVRNAARACTWITAIKTAFAL